VTKLHRSIFALLILALSAFTLAPLSAAAAPTVQPSAASVTQNIPITGTIPANAGNTFAGVLNVTNVAVQNGQLVANGTLSGTLNDLNGQPLGTVTDVPVALPLAVTGTCQILHLTLGPLDLNLLGLVVHLNQVNLDITAQSGPGNLLGKLLCAVTHLLDNGGPLTAISNFLNRIFALVPSLLSGIGVTGGSPATAGGTFAGTLNLNSVAVQNGQLVGVGTLSGVLTDLNGQPLGTVTNTPVTLPLLATGTCDILHLTLGPLDLNLLGLRVQLSQVVLDITAQSGPGNLLGNLLCAVTHLLDGGGPLAAIANLLNNILAILNGL
jgi:hypothetical protein